MILMVGMVSAQQTATFESFVNGPDEVYNGSEVPSQMRTFTDAGVMLDVTFTTFPSGFTSWNDFAISSVVDTITPGFGNQYAARPGSGVDGSSAYAVSFGSGAKMYLTDDAIGEPVEGMYITNSTYTYYTIRDGNDFSKAFGGDTGNDPDYFLLTIKGYRNGELTTDSVDFLLADYRFSDNSQDYIVDEWEYVDLTSLGAVDSLTFTYFSTDANDFGLLTPTYFCVDNITTAGEPSSVNPIALRPDVTVYPNPVQASLNLSTTAGLVGNYRVVDQFGRIVHSGAITPSIRLDGLNRGQYVLLLESEQGLLARRFLKQ